MSRKIRNQKDVRKVRRNMDITQKQLADICGVSQSFISSVENGRKKLSQKRKAAIAEFLNIEFD